VDEVGQSCETRIRYVVMRDELDPLCEHCGSLERMEPAGSPQHPYWACTNCDGVTLA
jgi:hypothetical protein